MTPTRVAVLTPPGSAAVAVIAVRGPDAWPVIRELFRTNKGEQLSAPPTGFAFGRLGDRAADEVILTSHSADSFEIHCHGGRLIIAWLLDLFRGRGITEVDSHELTKGLDHEAWNLLRHASTPRTAAILLDQAQGAYPNAMEEISRGDPEANTVRAFLRRNARVGRHLVEPWKVAIAGAPNAGKSSLLNALAGFSRSVVSPIPGTTRDAVSVSLAFEGWPVELVDTAGLREAPDALEREGVDRARAAVEGSDLVLWVVDATGPLPASTGEVARNLGVTLERLLVVLNKTDLIAVPPDVLPEAVRVSALTGDGLFDLASRLAAALVPDPPQPGEPVPYTPEECDRWSAAE
jgi:tRNA modification GTPase